jgi:Nitroreductase family
MLFRKRRSAQAYDGKVTMPARAFYALLDALLPRPGCPPWSAWPFPAWVHPVLFVHRVEGLAAGLYLLVRDATALPALKTDLRPEWLWQKAGPEHLPLFLLLPHDLRETAGVISCRQAIAARSCFALGMLADFSILEGAPWCYRHLYWECGILGQVLYLEAEAAGLRGTGIGCFFDEEMHRLLGIRNRRWQSLYHFTVGGPLEDKRLATLPPYQRADRKPL